jgi:hypothetical protein
VGELGLRHKEPERNIVTRRCRYCEGVTLHMKYPASRFQSFYHICLRCWRHWWRNMFIFLYALMTVFAAATIIFWELLLLVPMVVLFILGVASSLMWFWLYIIPFWNRGLLSRCDKV